MTDHDTDRIAEWSKALTKNVRIALFATTDDRSRAMEAFCTRLRQSSPQVLFEKEAAEADLPYIQIDNLRYHGVPKDRELAPFLSFAGSGPTDPPEGDPITGLLTAVTLPSPMTIYITPTCPHCPKTVGRLLTLSRCNPMLRPVIVDGSMFPEAAARAGVKSVPTVIADEDFRWTGKVPPSEVLEILANRDPARLGTDSLKSMIHAGDAEKVADMMCDHGGVFPAYIPLLTHPKWPVRLGAMVVFEYLVERCRSLAAGLIPVLGEQFDSLDDTVKGDVLYLLGQSGIPSARPLVRRVAESDGPEEIAEAAREALATLQNAAGGSSA